jgi:hypothetical protein
MPSIFGRDIDGPAPASERSAHRLVTVGRVLLLVELCLYVSALVAGTSDTFLAPPILIVVAMDHWILVSAIVVLICGLEFAFKRTVGSAFVVVFAVAFATAPAWVRYLGWRQHAG